MTRRGKQTKIKPDSDAGIGLFTDQLFSGLSEKSLKELSALARKRTFKKGSHLFFSGDGCQQIFFVRTGRVKVYRTPTPGREQTLHLLEAGDTCACHPGETPWTCNASARALTSCEVWSLPRPVYLRAIEQNPQVSKNLNRLLAVRLCQCNQLIEQVALQSTRERLVRYLLEQWTLGKAVDGTVPLLLTRGEIGHRIGATRETVSRQLHALKRQKLIEVYRSKVVLRNHSGLVKLLSNSEQPELKPRSIRL